MSRLLNDLMQSAAAVAATAGDVVLSWVGQAVVLGTLLAAATWLLTRALGRRLTPAAGGALWLVVLIKFVAPAGPGWSWSLSSAADRASRWIGVAAYTNDAVAVGGLQSETRYVALAEAMPGVGSAAAGWDARRVWPAALAGLYLFGAGLAGAIGIRRHLRLSRRCRAYPPADASVAALVAATCARIGLRRVPCTRVSAAAPAPYVFGMLRPQLVLSPQQLARPEELEAVILHELAHLRRGDLFVRYLQWFAGTMLFFWPVVAWVNRRIDLAREHACDAWALRHGRLSGVEYARCLLRALTAASTVRSGYRAAAMAASRHMVERRIEMILSETKGRGLSGSLGLPAAIALAGWSIFTLTGAAAPPTPADAPATEEKKVMVFVESADDEGGIATHDMIVSVDGDEAAVEHLNVEATEDGGQRVFTVRLALPDAELESFRAAHPTADADADGKLTLLERDGYMAAVAATRPDAVLAQFPKADRNQDGRLDNDEVLRLVQFGAIDESAKMFNVPVDGPDRGGPVVVTRVNAPDGQAGDGLKEIIVHHETTTNDPGVRTATRINTGGPDGACMPALPNKAVHDWLLANVDATPTAADVSKEVAAMKASHLRAFQQLHPEADANGDGRVTDAERSQFFEQMQSRTRAKMLARHPEADTDGDGVLSGEEMKAFARGMHLRMGGRPAAGADEDIVIIRGDKKGDLNEADTTR